MFFGKDFITKQKNDIFRFINKSLREDVKNNDNSDISLMFLRKDNITKEILKSYNNRVGTDFQTQLIGMLSPMVIEKLEKKLSADLDLFNDNEINKTQNELGMEMDPDKREELKKEMLEKGEEFNPIREREIQKEIIKSTYEATLEEYNNLKEKLYTGVNGQVKTGEFSVGEKMGTKLVVYENYMRKLDMQYKSMSGNYIVKEDKEIREKEEEYTLQANKNQEIVDKKVEKNNIKINELNKRLDEKMDKIFDLSNHADEYSPEEYSSKMEGLQESYMDDFAKLKYLEQDKLNVFEQAKEKQKYEEFAKNSRNESYNEDKSKLIEGKVARKEDRSKFEEEKNFEDTKANILNTSENVEEAKVVLSGNNEFKEELKTMVLPDEKIIKNYEKDLQKEDMEKENERNVSYTR